MAGSAADCQAMIDACATAGVKLMIAYRLHFEEANLRAIEAVLSGRIGEPRLFASVFTQQVREGNVRLDADLDGGPLEDIGIYCINAARYLFRAEPTEVFASATWPDDRRFREVPEMVSAILRFPGERLAHFTCGFGESKTSLYRVVGTKGDLFLEPAYTWNGDIHQVVTVGDDKQEETFKQRDQVGPEILYFSDCVLTNKEPEPSGLEGLIDVRIIEALRESYADGKPVALGALPAKKRRPTLEQDVRRPVAKEDDLVNAEPPGK
jgi:glucose-fructose oxidoreductase